jgi:hypothetical protein
MNNPLMFRIVAWSVGAAFVTLIFVCFGIGFPEKIIEAWFEGKLAFLGLIIAGGTFTYAIWTDMVERAFDRLHDPAWEYQRPAQIAGIRDHALPHNRRILANYVTVGLCLLLSLTFDFLIVLVDQEPSTWRCISTALFAFGLLPFLEIWYRYASALAAEFGGYAEWFRQAQ